MTRRAFIAALAAAVVVRSQVDVLPPHFAQGRLGRYGKWYRTPKGALASSVENVIVLDGTEMKRWIDDQITAAIENNQHDETSLRRRISRCVIHRSFEL